MRIHRIENFTHGVVNTLEPKSIPPGSASRSLNWHTLGDKIEIRHGYAVVGDDEGAGKVTGVHVATRDDGQQIGIKSFDRKVKFYDEGIATPAWSEILDESAAGNIIPAAADGEDVSFSNVKTLAGSQMWLNSPNGAPIKVMINKGTAAVPPTAKNQYDSSHNFKGYIKIKLNRTLLFGRLGDSSLRGSFVDKRTYTTVTAEVVGSGNGVLLTFSATLAAVSGKRTCFAITATAPTSAGTETFTDNRNGTLTGSLGGSGTINYATGAISLTFANPVNAGVNNVTADYQWEDSTVDGLADFDESGTRLASEGFFLGQGEGGQLQFVASYRNVDYCFHERVVYKVTLQPDDLNAENVIFSERAGIPNHRAAAGTGEGIYFVDASNTTDVAIRLLRFDQGSSEVVPVPVSTNIDLSGFVFDKAVVEEWDDYIVVACATVGSVDSNDEVVNNRLLLYHKLWKSWDVDDLYAADLAIKDGALWAGSPVTKNVHEIYSGFDDDGAPYDNYWESNLDEQKVAELKRSRTLRLEGEIQPDQAYNVYLAGDNDDFILIGTVEGTGSYVDQGTPVLVGRQTVGKNPIGGSNDADEVVAYHYYHELSVRRVFGKYQRIKIKFEATAVGYVSVSSYEFFDITLHGTNIPRKYKVES